MDIIIVIFIILLFTILLLYITSFLFDTSFCLENFTTPNFIQVFPASGSAPLTVSFVPIYRNEFSPFTIDFGDNTKYISQTTDEFVHTYTNKGTYNGIIIFNNPNNTLFKDSTERTKQNFTITCT